MIRALRRRGWPTLRIIAGIVEQACDGIHYAHDVCDEVGNHLRIVHRDISPPNLLVTTNGVVKLLDFGISKSRQSVVQTMTGQIRGKFSYMSPEQLQSKPLDRRSDVFSLGIVLHELICGRRLFRRPTRLQVYHAITTEPIPPLSGHRADIPEALEAVVRRALARDRDDRFASARDFADALRRAADSFGGPADSKELGEFVDEYFSAELESKRQLFTDPSSVPVDLTSEILTDPTVNLRGPDDEEPTGVGEITRVGVTEPDATIPGFVNTKAHTVTADLGDDKVADGSVDQGLGEPTEVSTDQSVDAVGLPDKTLTGHPAADDEVV
jgi:serine/threonine-protein kinase